MSAIDPFDTLGYEFKLPDTRHWRSQYRHKNGLNLSNLKNGLSFPPALFISFLTVTFGKIPLKPIVHGMADSSFKKENMGYSFTLFIKLRFR